MVIDVDVDVEVTGRYFDSTYWRVFFLLPFYEIAEDMNIFSIDIMLKSDNIIDSHLNYRERSRRWDSLGGRGSLLSYLPYYVIYSRGSGVRAPSYLNIDRHYLNVYFGGWSIN